MPRTRNHPLRIDYEVLNAALGIEINVALSKETIRHVIQSRFAEMTREERNNVPDKVMGVIKSVLQEPEVSIKKRKVKFEFTAPDAILLKLTGKTNIEVLRLIISSNAWAEWSHKTNARIHSTEQGIVIESRVLQRANTSTIAILMKSFGV